MLFTQKSKTFFEKNTSCFLFCPNIEGLGFDHVDVCKTKFMNTACRQKIWTSQKGVKGLGFINHEKYIE